MNRPNAVMQRLAPLGACVAMAIAAASCSTTQVESGTAPTAPSVSSGASEPSTTSAPVTTLDRADSTTSTGPDPDSTTTTEPIPADDDAIVPLTGWDAVDRYLEVTLLRGGSRAASVAVLDRGQVRHVAAFGERVPGDPVDPDDRFRIASISKTVLAVAVLDMVEDELIALDEPIGAQIAAHLDVAQPADGAPSITVRHLLTHRSGFRQNENLFFNHEVDSCAQAAAVGIAQELQSVPGTNYQYSNMNFCVLGLYVELVTGKPYDQVVRERVLTPVGTTGMRTATTFDVGIGDVEHVTAEGRNYMEVLGAAGAWLATPSDLVRLIDSLDPVTAGNGVLDDATVDEMATITTDPEVAVTDSTEPDTNGSTTTTIEPQAPTRGYGMGLIVFERPTDASVAASAFGHTGTLENTHALVMRRPDGLTWALLVSGDYPDSTPALARIMENALLLGGFIDATYEPAPTS